MSISGGMDKEDVVPCLQWNVTQPQKEGSNATAATQVALEIMIPSEASQTEKASYVTTHMRNLKTQFK